MTTIVNTPVSKDPKESMVMIVGLIVLMVMAYMFIVYGLPVLRQIGSPQINVPSKIDVNINQQDK